MTSYTTNERWNNAIDRLINSCDKSVSINLCDLMQNLKHSTTRSVQVDGQNYTAVFMEDIVDTLESMIPKISTPVQEPVKLLTSEQIEQRALESLKALDISDDALGDSGRVRVDEKAMINCRADLNQLVPFKYEFAWQAYLKATSNHWMHTEIPLANDAANHWDTCDRETSRSILNSLYSLELLSTYRSEDPVLAIYRYLTNPEARQYLLRQRFELTVIGNFVNAVIDSFSPYQSKDASRYNFTDYTYKMFLGSEPIAVRQQLRRSIASSVSNIPRDVTLATDSGIRETIRKLINYYVSFTYIFTFSALIEVLSINHKDPTSFPELTFGYKKVFTDIVTHLNFGLLAIRQVIEENYNVMTPDFIKSVRNELQEHVLAEFDCMSNWSGMDRKSEYSPDHQLQTLCFMVNRFTEFLGLGGAIYETASTPAMQWYVELYESSIPDLNGGGASVLSATNSGSGTSLNW